MTTARNISLVVAAVLITSVTYLGFDRSPAGPQAIAVAAPAGAPVEIRPDLDRLIGVFEERTTVSSDPLDFRYLGRLYLAKARLTAYVPTYRLARASLARARDLYPDDIQATGLEAQAAFFLHEFAEARTLNERWQQLKPDNIDATALTGDIDLAVGNVEEARRSYEVLAQAAPTHPAVQARFAQLAVSEGDPIGGLSRATTAEAAAAQWGFTGPSLAWYQSFMGQLAFDVGEYERSERHFASALENFPGSAHDRAGIARAKAALGDIEGAITLLELATVTAGAVDDLGYLGDLYSEAERPDEAEATFQLIENQLADGTLDIEVHSRLAALYFLDHGVHLDLALELAEADLEKRPDAGAWDTYAWALFKHGRLVEAQEASQRAQATGVREAAFNFHAAAIANALGDTEGAIAGLETVLQISPRFHPVHASVAVQLLEALRR